MAYSLLNSKFQTIGIVDDYDTLIWTERYDSVGDFELHMAASSAATSLYNFDCYLYSDETDRLMIVEGSTIISDEDAGNTLTVRGRSLESILSRRIIWNYTVMTGGVQAVIKRLLNENMITPSDPARKYPNFSFADSTDPLVTNPQVSVEYQGENLLEVVKQLCGMYNLGFQITYDDSGNFTFKLYAGKDRSSKQTTNQLVLFSPNFDNLSKTNYAADKSDFKNVTLIAGSGEPAEKRYLVTTQGGASFSGAERREVYTDAASVSKDLPAADYDNQLLQKGYEGLYDHRINQKFDGEVEQTNTFAYNKHFFMGDIVEMESEYGIVSTSRVTEFIRSSSRAGNKAYPTLDAQNL